MSASINNNIASKSSYICGCIPITKRKKQSVTDTKVITATQPVLQDNGSWVIEIDGKKYGLSELK